MKGSVRSQLSSLLTALVMALVIALPLAVSTTHASVAHASRQIFPAKGGLDCNGYSQIQQPIVFDPTCAEFGEEDNGHYVGHDEPSVQFISSAPGSGNNVEWQITLPKEHSLPATQTLENQVAFWFSMALCDPNSFPQNPCTPDSDSNPPARFHMDPTTAGSAILEFQFYSPGSQPFGCNATRWCASMHLNSVECTASLSCNPNCLETTNFAYIQMDGIPTGPPGPASMNQSTFTPNAETLLMNQGDSLKLTIKDTTNGVLTRVVDQTTGKSGFMIASAANGFQSLNVNTCAPTNFNFHPEFSTARFGNFVNWTGLQANVGFATETGHFEVGSGDGDRDDTQCFPGPVVAGCIGTDFDFDGTSYQADWPDGTSNTPTSLQIHSVLGKGIGPVSSPNGLTNYTHPYTALQFETIVLLTEAAVGTCCHLPPLGATFYPFFAQSGSGTHCALTFGNDIRGATVNDFGRDAQYGRPDLVWLPFLLSSGVQPNPCIPHA